MKSSRDVRSKDEGRNKKLIELKVKAKYSLRSVQFIFMCFSSIARKATNTKRSETLAGGGQLNNWETISKVSRLSG